jgi:hypothetical protein
MKTLNLVLIAMTMTIGSLALAEGSPEYSEITAAKIANQKFVSITNYKDEDKSTVTLKLTGKDRVAIECEDSETNVYAVKGGFPYSRDQLADKIGSSFSGAVYIHDDQRHLLTEMVQALDEQSTQDRKVISSKDNLFTTCKSLEAILMTTAEEDAAFDQAKVQCAKGSFYQSASGSCVTEIEMAPESVVAVPLNSKG